MTETLREQMSGITVGLVSLFTIGTAVYGLTGFNIYTEILGLGADDYKYLYGLFGLLAAERLYSMATDGVSR